MKKIKIYIISFISIFVLFLGIGIIAEEIFGIKETHQASSEETFVLSNNQKYQSFTAGSSSYTASIKNQSSKSSSFDLLLLCNTKENTVYSSNVSLASKATTNVTVSGLSSGTEYTVYVTEHKEYKYYISSFFELELLQNEYRHSIENNDTDIKDFEEIYTLKTILTEEEFQQGSYYTINSKGKYVVALSFNDGVEYYEKTYIYKDLYNKNAYKEIYLLKDIIVEEDFEMNIPASLFLLNKNIIVKDTFSISHYYGSLFGIESITGKIENQEENSLVNIYTPNAYYYGIGTIFTSDEETHKKITSHVDFTEESYHTALLEDAMAFVNKYFEENYILEDESITTFLRLPNLPHNFFDFDIAYQYRMNNNPWRYQQEADNQLQTIDVELYEGNQKVEGLTTSHEVLIVGTSDSAIVEAYSLELEHFIKKTYDSQSVKIYIGDSSDMTSLSYKYQKDFIYNASSSNEEIVDTNLLEILPLNETSKSIYLNRNGYISLNTPLPYLAVTLNGSTEYIEIELRSMTPEEKTEYIARYIEDIFFSDKNQKELLNPDSDSIHSMNIEYLYYKPIMTITVMGPDDQPIVTNSDASSSFTIVREDGQIYLSPNFIEHIDGRNYYIQTIAIYVGDSFQDVDFTTEEEIQTFIDDNIDLLLKNPADLTEDEKEIYDFLIARYIRKEIIVTSVGLGGDGDASYFGREFKKKFSENQELLGEISGLKTTGGMYFDMEIMYSTMEQYATSDFKSIIPTGMSYEQFVKTYLSLTFTTPAPSENRIANIKVTPENVPIYNTVVFVKTYIDDSLNDVTNRTDCYEQEYSFVIPGIIPNTESGIPDTSMYELLKTQFNRNYPDGDVRSEYILYGEATREMDKIDLSNSGVTNIKGISYFTNTKEFVLDGINLSSQGTELEKMFINCANSVTKLSMNQCSLSTISKEVIQLQYLEEISLADNLLTSVPVFFRRLKKLDLSRNSTLTNINGISKNVAIEDLWLESCKISYFEEIKSLSNLKNLYVYDNVPTSNTTFNSTIMYGTEGAINQSIWILLVDRGINVYTVSYVDNKDYIYYDVNGNVIRYAYHLNDDQSIQQEYSATCDGLFVTNEVLDGNGHKINCYTEDGTLVNSIQKIMLVYNVSYFEKKAIVAINSIAYFSKYVSTFTLRDTLYEAEDTYNNPGASGKQRPISIISVDSTNYTGSSVNQYYSINLSNGPHSVILCVTYEETVGEEPTTITKYAYREIQFEVVNNI